MLSFPGEYDGVEVRSDNWWGDDQSRSRVYGEYLRIAKYTKTGDIALLEGDELLTVPP